MENKFYTDDFEQFLKESADDFRMYPSRRVWNSLYNDLHPGRKWPSMTVFLLILSSFLFIGVAHRNEFSGNLASNQDAQKLAALDNNHLPNSIAPANSATENTASGRQLA